MAFCTNCGQQLVGGEKFCASCGTTTLEPAPTASQAGTLPPAHPPYAYAQQPVIVPPAAPNESGMAAAFKGLLLWFVIAVVFLVAMAGEGADARVGALLLSAAIAIAYVIGKVRAGRRRGAIVSNVWAAYGAVIFLIVMAISSIASHGGGDAQPSKAKVSETSGTAPSSFAPAPVISADSLFWAYEQNEVAADQEYKGRTMRITGRVGSINKDFTDNVYIVLPSSENMYEGVHAEIAESDTNKAASLRKGQNITVTCEISGKVLTDVMAKNCVIGD